MGSNRPGDAGPLGRAHGPGTPSLGLGRTLPGAVREESQGSEAIGLVSRGVPRTDSLSHPPSPSGREPLFGRRRRAVGTRIREAERLHRGLQTGRGHRRADPKGRPVSKLADRPALFAGDPGPFSASRGLARVDEGGVLVRPRGRGRVPVAHSASRGRKIKTRRHGNGQDGRGGAQFRIGYRSDLPVFADRENPSVRDPRRSCPVGETGYDSP